MHLVRREEKEIGNRVSRVETKEKVSKKAIKMNWPEREDETGKGIMEVKDKSVPAGTWLCSTLTCNTMFVML